MQPFMLLGGAPTLQVSASDISNSPALLQRLQSFNALLATWVQKLASVINTNLAPNAPTAGRPTAKVLATMPGAGVGYSLFDTTLQAPVWWTGTGWVNALGAAV